MQYFISKFENYINKIIYLDEEACYALKKMNKKVIAFEFENTKLVLYVTPTENGLSIHTEHKKNPDVSIKSTPSNFLRTFLCSKSKIPVLPIDMQVEGDITLARNFQDIMSNLQVDFEEPLSKLMGDTLAFQISRFIQKTGSTTFTVAETIMLDISEYLRFEVEILPDELLINEFSNEVDFLRDETELVSKRIDKLNLLLSKNKNIK